MKTVLFVCIHNSGRSQMAEALFNAQAKERGIDATAHSAGTLGCGTLNLVCVQAMAEIGISMEGQYPKVLTQEMAEGADIIVSMGCGVDAEACPTRFLVTEDWGLDDPKGLPIEEVRLIRDQIENRVARLFDKL